MRVFVYGTLLKGNSNHDVYLKDALFLGKARAENFALYSFGAYPGAVPEKGEAVLGEVYEIDESTLEKLDVLEEEVELYLRQKTRVVFENGTAREAYIYVYNDMVSADQKVSLLEQPWKEQGGSLNIIE